MICERAGMHHFTSVKTRQKFMKSFKLFAIDEASFFFCWEIPVICAILLLILAVTAFISPPFRTLWIHWFIFFGHFKKISISKISMTEKWPKENPDPTKMRRSGARLATDLLPPSCVQAGPWKREISSCNSLIVLTIESVCFGEESVEENHRNQNKMRTWLESALTTNNWRCDCVNLPFLYEAS